MKNDQHDIKRILEKRLQEKGDQNDGRRQRKGKEIRKKQNIGKEK